MISYFDKHPLETFLMALVTYLLGAFLFGIYTTHHEETRILDELDRRLLVGAKSIKYLLAEDFHDRALDSQSIGLEEALRNQTRISAFASETDFVYAYTLVLKDGKFYFTAPTVTKEELQIKKNWYFHPYDDAPEEFFSAIENKSVTYATYSDQWGTFRSVAYPQTSPGGRTYLACTDYDISYIKTLSLSSILYSSLTILPMLLLTIPLAYGFRIQDRRHNIELKNINAELTRRANDLSTSKKELEKEISHRQIAEKQLQQAQKLETIGTLAGGIAHDFNNLLFPILGYTEMIMSELPKDSPLRYELNGINSAAMRAKDLVDQILAFSRQETGEMMLIRMQPIIKEALKLIRATIPATIDIKSYISNQDGAIHGDPTQIHQIIMNLTTNAFHAMEETGGILEVRLEKLAMTKANLIASTLSPGTYFCLSVSDTGAGMSNEILQRIFDPFFTTKQKGKGTGMGLAVVHGIVTRMKGAVKVESIPGNGSTFSIYLPSVQSTFDEQAQTSPELIQGGSESILIVDDETEILKLEKQFLTRLGYHVHAFTSAADALDFFRKNALSINLVISDMAMPKMTGKTLAVELIKIRPDIPILLCTGFSTTISDKDIHELGIKAIFKKPIILKDLGKKIRVILDGSTPDRLSKKPYRP